MMTIENAPAATRISEIGGDRAEWSMLDSEVIVRAVLLADGTQMVFEPKCPLTEAFSRMPRPLWYEVKFRSDLVRGSTTPSVNGARS